jgi:hypothetical protein
MLLESLIEQEVNEFLHPQLKILKKFGINDIDIAKYPLKDYRKSFWCFSEDRVIFIKNISNEGHLIGYFKVSLASNHEKLYTCSHDDSLAIMFMWTLPESYFFTIVRRENELLKNEEGNYYFRSNGNVLTCRSDSG